MSLRFPAITSKQVVKVLGKIGFEFSRQSGGSHAVYYNSTKKLRTVVPIHPRTIIKRKTLRSIVASTGLSLREFKELL